MYPVGAGLHNVGNTCFLNAGLQCLTHTPPLANYLLSGEHSQTCEWGGPARRAAGEEECPPVLLPALRSAPLCVALARAVRVSGCACSAPSCLFLRPEVILVSGEALSLLGVARTEMGPRGSAGFLGAELGVPHSPCLRGAREGRAQGCVQAAAAVAGGL